MFDQMAGGEWEMVLLKQFLGPILMCVGGENRSSYTTKEFSAICLRIQLISDPVEPKDSVGFHRIRFQFCKIGPTPTPHPNHLHQLQVTLPSSGCSCTFDQLFINQRFS